ncbi:cytochrome b/b6 domain-containing protein [Rhabdochromatium marinum]|uniref:cytochrome b/b6 domain-containing protein n=1 Tax=Rhabdochromatium marinum TaxID=48729 RepID=UPI001903B0B7|nr:cytochrome b/b6 domain-containing protein [Rhabdochromatium marinum]MBK1647687.1 cytochrome B [Rhabdochromatium marinum]
MSLQAVRIWDLPTRVFHWTLVLLVLLAFLTGLQGGNWMVWHERAGLGVLGLLSFRLVWGFVGSTYARFADFIPTPARILAYLQGRWQGLGHNPLGALSVFALLGVLLFQVLSGLFATDDIAFQGPLFSLVSSDLSDRLSGWHRQTIWLIGALVALHILAALFYTLVRRQNLIRPMVTGMKSVEEARVQPTRGGGGLALLAALLVAALVVWVGAGGLLPPPPPPAPPPAW